MQTLEEIDAKLSAIRAAKDVALPPCALTTDAFRSNPPHRVGIYHLLYKPRFMLLDPTGTGKTPQALIAYAYLKSMRPDFRLIICTRKSAVFQWQERAHQFIHGVRVEVVGYNPKRPSEEWTQARREQQYARYFGGETDILIASYHTLARDWSRLNPKSPPNRPDLARIWASHINPDLLGTYALVLDEVQVCKAPHAKVVAPAMRLLSRHARYCWGLTATPVMSHLEDVYGIVETVRPGTFYSYRDDFAAKYLKEVKLPVKGRKWSYFYKVVGYQNLPHLMARLGPYYLQRPLEDFEAYLPAVTIESRLVDLSAKQRGLYDQIQRQFFPQQDDTTSTGSAQRLAESHAKAVAREAQAAEEECRAVLPATLSKLASLTYAQLAVDAPQVLGVESPNAKLDETIRFLSEEAATEKVIIYTRFEQVATVIVEALTAAGISTVRITGKESGGERRKAQAAFQTDPATRVICITSAGGEAIDLQCARVLMFYDLPWSWGEWMQVLGRARRQGSPHQSLLVILLGTSDTIDTKTLTLLQTKEKLVNATFTSTSSLLTTTSFDGTTEETPTPLTTPAGAPSGVVPVNTSFINDLFDRMRAED